MSDVSFFPKRKVRKIGGSLAVLLPKDVVRGLDLHDGDEIRFVIENGKAALQVVRETDVSPIAEPLKRILAKYDPEQIWLFGSRAEGRAREESDYDLLLVFPNDVTHERTGDDDTWKITENLPVAVDLLFYTKRDFNIESRVEGMIAHQAAKKGKLIYERNH